MTANQPPDPRFDAELKEWMEHQEPTRPADGIADAVIARVSMTNQGRQPSFLLSLGTAAMAAVVAAMALSTGVLMERAAPGGKPVSSTSPTAVTGSRIPAGGHVIPLGQPNLDLAYELFAHPGGTWVSTSTNAGRRSLVRLDPATGEIAAEVDNAGWAAAEGSNLWAMVGGGGRAPGTLTQLDPATGAALRTLDGVEGYIVAIDGTTAWVPAPDALLRVDLMTGDIVERIAIPVPVWEDIPIVVTDGSVWVIGDPGLVKVDTTSVPATATVVFDEQVRVAVNAAGSIWARVAARNVVVEIDAQTSRVIREVALPNSQTLAQWGSMSVADGGLWTAVAGGLVRIDVVTGSVGELLPLPWGFYWGMEVIGDEMWVTVQDESEVIHFPLPPG
jgi:hypothetical protein